MPQRTIICPLCRFEAPSFWFEGGNEGKLRCRRCRSIFEDADSCRADTVYADCDSTRVVTRFQFELTGRNTMIRVPEGYLAFVVNNRGEMKWLDAYENPVPGGGYGLQLYYLCLNPRVMWGTRGVRQFGAYGSAALSVSAAYMKQACDNLQRVKLLEDHFRDLVSDHMTEYVRRMTERYNPAVLERKEGYQNALGVLEGGVSLTGVDPAGYRSGDGRAAEFPRTAPQPVRPEREEPMPRQKIPVEFVALPVRQYTVRPGTEDVFFRAGDRTDRHKAGEQIGADELRGVQKLFRFTGKEFEYPFGWGIYNAASPYLGYFSANGTISFYIDSTEKLSRFLAKTETWKAFEEQFFVNVLRREMELAMKGAVGEYLDQQGADPTAIAGHLSAMSVELSNRLNGEHATDKTADFRLYGLRVKRTDVFSLEFYSDRR